MSPKAITTALTALHYAPANHRAVQNHAAAQTVLLALRQKIPTLQDQQVLFADFWKRLNEASRILSETKSSAEATVLANLFLQKVVIFSRTSGGRVVL